MQVAKQTLKNLLVGQGYINEKDFSKAEKEAENKELDIQAVMVSKNFMRDENIGQLIADEFNHKFITLQKERIPTALLHIVPESLARNRQIIPFEDNFNTIKLGMRDPDDLQSISIVEKKSGKGVVPFYITEMDFQTTLMRYKTKLHGQVGNLIKRFQGSLSSKEKKDELIVKIVNSLIEDGYHKKSSDLHLEPYEDKVSVRYRIDGIMQDILELPIEVYSYILTRLKIMAKLRIDEHLKAQDGKIRFSTKDEKIDIRVSIMPVTYGENVVMRLLSETSRQYNLKDLGFSDIDYKKVMRAIKNPHGMILISGPTGSGKTTSVYAMLKILNTREVHIASIEDPVEYDIKGVTQIQVNNKAGITFAAGLRSIVRQDPDTIMIGEIRDEETSSIAVNSAMTGHLVLSTLHANDSATTIPRFYEMGIEPFLLASTINIVISQRLVRNICMQCRASYEISPEERKAIEKDNFLYDILKDKGHKNLKRLRLYKGTGCNLCNNTGYHGRTGIYEALEMNNNLKELIVGKASSNEIIQAARDDGMTTMMEDGIEKVLLGITTIEEIMRATKE